MAYGALVIEDEGSLARNIKGYLEVDGFDVRICGDGERGLKLAESFRPNIIVVDLKLPGMDGLAVLRQLRERQDDARVIILTGHGSVQTAVEAIKGGAYEYLTKPVVLSELRRLIKRALHEERTEGALAYYCRRTVAELDGLVGTASL
jgi:two-component system, NtrC family, response regulator AtoC